MGNKRIRKNNEWEKKEKKEDEAHRKGKGMKQKEVQIILKLEKKDMRICTLFCPFPSITVAVEVTLEE